MTDELPEWLAKALSKPRMATYLAVAGGDAETAMRLYWWNVSASAAFYGPLHCLEVTLRNALHDELVRHHGRPDWWVSAPLNSNGLRLVDEAREKCRRNGTSVVCADGIVAELSFGFWISLVSGARGYDRGFWVPVTHKAFPHYSGRRAGLHDSLLSLVRFRNRIMHHEPVFHRHLAADHAKIYRVLGYLSPQLAKEAQAMDRFPAVLADRADVVGGVWPPRF
ncbi:hypothetical protein [Streptomyces stelliscabiei]|nr:hypothetical protein [Streptomyces stelliscabiei]SOD76451.1 hypothetical protein SAMN06272781_4297 [Streptomyces sp. 1222.2]MDX2556006.1 hypothetical protein [Streptomyces stelliscabiei]MDX2617557.1 hypothetical protein [Streptomyces stelliscabiei]MDX2641698.1 hypothetical protein [Streptomyces stelliscabiei]MDX2666668.1 hypothetical protein [Streptomyces stelliscabiei]